MSERRRAHACVSAWLCFTTNLLAIRGKTSLVLNFIYLDSLRGDGKKGKGCEKDLSWQHFTFYFNIDKLLH